METFNYNEITAENMNKLSFYHNRYYRVLIDIKGMAQNGHNVYHAFEINKEIVDKLIERGFNVLEKKDDSNKVLCYEISW